MEARAQAAEQGDVASEFNLGLMYDNGLGVAQNATEAAKWYRAAAERDLAATRRLEAPFVLHGLGSVEVSALAIRTGPNGAAPRSSDDTRIPARRASSTSSLRSSKINSFHKSSLRNLNFSIIRFREIISSLLLTMAVATKLKGMKKCKMLFL